MWVIIMCIQNLFNKKQYMDDLKMMDTVLCWLKILGGLTQCQVIFHELVLDFFAIASGIYWKAMLQHIYTIYSIILG